ncbi:hypothetical protein J1N35_004474 [Gossypium stocksii]|uniref:Uncharacterized protein n=1 Tax=Gossypium stocksii TaxID=47602 RepID=A0A9D3WBZ6_9ROSI|nr:hypothetical protein J1N35_004474 [Gossypium stocksii]
MRTLKAKPKDDQGTAPWRKKTVRVGAGTEATAVHEVVLGFAESILCLGLYLGLILGCLVGLRGLVLIWA